MKQGFIRNHTASLSIIYRMIDALLIGLALVICCSLYQLPFNKDWLLVSLIGAIAFVFAAETVDLYRSWRADRFLPMVGLIIIAWSVVCALLLLLGYFTKTGSSYSRLVIGSWFVSVLSLLISWRYLFGLVLRYLRSHDRNTRSCGIIGLTEAAQQLQRDLLAESQLGIRLKGFYRVSELDDTTQLSDPSLLLGDVTDAVQAAKSGELEIVYIALPLKEEALIADILRQFADTTATVHLLPNFFIYNLLHARWHQVGQTPLLSVYDTPITGINGWLKRLEDLALSTLILLLISPIMIAIAAAIKLTSPGPVIFKQNRYGLDGRLIKVWKFRSMTTMDNGDQVKQATRNDSRITPLGGFLRRTSLDELPQFFNVLQGTMSIVGPRPHATAHNEQYRELVDGYMLRHKVKPGITGWAQVNGWRGETDTLEKMDKRVEHDLYYIRHWSIWLDIRIVFLTIFRGFIGKNAY